MQERQNVQLVISDKSILALLEMLEAAFVQDDTFAGSYEEVPEELSRKAFLYDFTMAVLRKKLNG